jgi:hypothetical protein
MLFKETTAVYSKDCTQCGHYIELLGVKVGGAYRYHCAVKDLNGKVEISNTERKFICNKVRLKRLSSHVTGREF